MKVLLDSHAFVWFLTGDRRLSRRAGALIADDESSVLFSAASAWEIATKVRAGKWPEAVEIAEDLPGTVRDRDFNPLAVTVDHGALAGSLPGEHRDPFDRMLAAQAIIEDVPLVTADPAFRMFEVETIW